MKLLRILNSVALSSVLAGSVVMTFPAAEAQTPKDFFPKDYVQKQEGSADSVGADSPRTPVTQPVTATPAPRGEAPLATTPALVPTIEDLTVFDALKVTGIGMVVSSLDSAHYEQKMEQIIDLIDKHTLTGLIVYAIGDVQTVSKSNFTMMAVARGLVVRVTDRPPETVPGELSPTFYVDTEKGRIILEAPPNLSQFFNARGEFVVRE